jgi:hypothetical protein
MKACDHNRAIAIKSIPEAVGKFAEINPATIIDQLRAE